MEDNKKICPLLNLGYLANSTNDKINCECIEMKCAFWLDLIYSTENIPQKGRCAIKFIAQKNSDGLLPV
jgi:hypothetical protein